MLSIGLEIIYSCCPLLQGLFTCCPSVKSLFTHSVHWFRDYLLIMSVGLETIYSQQIVYRLLTHAVHLFRDYSLILSIGLETTFVVFAYVLHLTPSSMRCSLYPQTNNTSASSARPRPPHRGLKGQGQRSEVRGQTIPRHYQPDHPSHTGFYIKRRPTLQNVQAFKNVLP